MSIVSSSFVEMPEEVDGRKYVTETHTDHLGNKYTFTYLADVGVDRTAVMQARASALETNLADMEAEAFFNGA